MTASAYLIRQFDFDADALVTRVDRGDKESPVTRFFYSTHTIKEINDCF